MALQVPLANDKKRVKVYELRDNDWFDRGTGFCTGQIVNVSTLKILRRSHFSVERDTRLFVLLASCLWYMLIGSSNRRNREYMSSRKTSQIACCSRQRLSRTTDTKNNKVNFATLCIDSHANINCRYPNSMDGDQWHRHGSQFSRGGWLRSDMVRSSLTLCQTWQLTGREKGLREPCSTAAHGYGARYARLFHSIANVP